MIKWLYILSIVPCMGQMFQQKLHPHVYSDRVIWSQDLTTQQLNGLDVWNDTVVVVGGGTDRNLYILDTSGNLKRTCSTVITASASEIVIVRPGVVYITDGGANSVIKYNYRTCSEIWEYSGLRGDPLQIKYTDDGVFVNENGGATDGGVVKIDTAGNLEYRIEPSDANTRIIGFDLFEDTIVYTTLTAYAYIADTNTQSNVRNVALSYAMYPYFMNDTILMLNAVITNINVRKTIRINKLLAPVLTKYNAYRSQNFNPYALCSTNSYYVLAGSSSIAGTTKPNYQVWYKDIKKGVKYIADLSQFGNVAVRYIAVRHGYVYVTVGGGVIAKCRL